MVMVLALALVLGGCMGSQAPPVRYYVLDAVAAPDGPAAPASELTVKLLELRLPQYLERPQIVTRSAPQRLELAEYHQWGGNLRKNLVSVMVQNLSRELGTSRVSGPPHRAGLDADLLVELEITRFERGPDRRVALAAWWRVLDGAGRTTLETRVSELESAPLVPGADYNTTVAAMAVMFARLGRDMAAAIRRHASPAGGRPAGA
ncbi:MAG: PqiC family protein [Gammaproteobacteria bacterium]|nr:PqiC family protein [Gammaproteobacteria bacterium]